MTEQLSQQLYNRIKQVVSKPVTLTLPDGRPIKNATDHTKIKFFHLGEAFTPDKLSLAIDDHPQLRAIPVYLDGKLVFLIIAELSAEDSQTIQVIHSLSELLIENFIVANKPKPDVVDLLLTRLYHRPNTITAEELEQTFTALGYKTEVQRAAIIVELKGFWSNYLETIGQPYSDKKNLITSKKELLERSLSSFFSRNQDNVIGYIGQDRFLVIKDLSETDYNSFYELLRKNRASIVDSLKNIHIKQIVIGVGGPARTISGIVTAVEQAKQAKEIGEKIRPSETIFRVDDLGVLPLLISSSVKQKQEYSERLVGDLIDDEELINTLDTFLYTDLNLTQTAKILKIHRNTVIYRLDKIRELVDKDPRRFNDAVELYLAVLFRRIFPD